MREMQIRFKTPIIPASLSLILMLCLTLIPVDKPLVAYEGNVSDYTAYVSSSGLNVRSGPGTSYSVISVLKRGQSVRVTHHYGIWRKIYLGPTKNAYVSGNYLSSSSSSRPPSTENTIQSSSSSSGDLNVSDYDARVTASGLNIRSGPSTGYRIIDSRPYNSRVRVTHHNGSWRRIAWSGGRAAYMHGNYLKKESSYFYDINQNPGNTGGTSTTSPTQEQSELVDVSDIQNLQNENPDAAERYFECMIGKITSKGGAAMKAWTIFRNGIKQGLKKIATSPMIGINHVYCAARAHEWASPPTPYSPQSQTCQPTMGSISGCKELESFYGTPEGIKIWDAFQFTSACDAECRLTCYYHGKNKRTYDAFVSDPRSNELKCRFTPPN